MEKILNQWCVGKVIVVIALLVFISFSVAEKSSASKIDNTRYAINVPAQNAISAFNQLSEQTGTNFIFPYDIAVTRVTAKVVGRYTVIEALNIMLQNSGLSSGLSKKGAIKIFLSDGSFDNFEGINAMNRKKNLLVSTIAFFVGASGASGVLAQGGAVVESGEFVLEEIVVTATKRETSLQDTALSVSAVSADTLTKYGITSFDQILASVPGATVVEAGPGNSKISFRGVATNTFIGGNKTTSTYIDEFPLALGDIDIKLVDIAQIEVLKGPQGTLYGQSALGGVMRYITNKPDFEAVSGGFEAGVSSVASGDAGYQGQGYLNVPLGENIAVRAVFYQQDNPGFIDNLGTGTKDVNSEEVTGGRLALRWAISDRAEFNVLYLNQSQEVGGGQGNGFQTANSSYTPVLSGAPTVITPPDISNPSERINIDALIENDFEVLNLKLDVSYDGFDLSLMGARKQRERAWVLDGGVWLGNYDDVTTTLIQWPNKYDTDTFEVRLVSSGDGPMEWIAGVWYEKEEGSISESWQIQTPRDDLMLIGALFADGDFFRNTNEFDDTEELAFYGEVAYRFTDKAKLTLGYRQADIEQNSGFLSATGRFDGAKSAQIGVNERVQEDVDTYKLNFEYTVNDDALVYALASSGYRGGGFNRGGISSTTSQYDSDTLWNYEVGARTSWMENRLIFNTVVYYIDWSDIQLRAYDDVALVQRIQNIGKAEVFGLEAEVSYQVTDSLRMSMNYSYIDAALAEDFLDTSTTPPTVLAENGERLPGSSKDTFSLFVDWQTPLTSSLDLQVNANYVYVGSRPNELGSLRAPFLSDDLKLPNSQIVNLAAGVVHANGVTVTLFANNLFDERSPQFVTGLGGAGLTSTVMNRPRTIGLRAGYQF